MLVAAHERFGLLQVGLIGGISGGSGDGFRAIAGSSGSSFRAAFGAGRVGRTARGLLFRFALCFRFMLKQGSDAHII
jgi:hypothetical protein